MGANLEASLKLEILKSTVVERKIIVVEY